jgi:hypothetical protein
MYDSSPARVISRLHSTLDGSGVHALLRELNARVPHRFTGIYRFDEPMLRNVRLFDRENPDLEIGTDLPLREAYCSILHRDNTPFSTDNARTDSRLPDVLAQGATIAYCGVPLGGYGALCHFDLQPRELVDSEIPIMAGVADSLLDQLLAQGMIPPRD